ncbi:hypothetical protein XA68_16344 [Ophiocordyceps unilateralis]|uniref:Uncharacterized protein n=1 Tax=Ophiocordyceps unilateralis TaxID=268505 RepID=A0A2A9P5T1_OPHUN|nr:hypothetical protein XA68_16344 [Ophiocordyceps unilateralis]
MNISIASALIAAGIFLARQICPNALVYICSKRLGYSNSAATCAYDEGVRPSVVWIGRLVPAVAILLSIASVVTPLGLYSVVVAGKPVEATFQYVRDSSIFGRNTVRLPDGDMPLRSCSVFTNISRPQRGCYTGEGRLRIQSVSPALREVFSSGADDGTLSTVFDIRWRRRLTKAMDNNQVPVVTSKPLHRGTFRSIKSILLNERYDAIEGLIVDTIKGGVGFRNHTVPIGQKLGAEWREDLLFVEPETVCVDTDISIDWMVDEGDVTYGKGYVADRGGLAGLALNKRPEPEIGHPQRKADLHGRARAAAWDFVSMFDDFFNGSFSTSDGSAASVSNDSSIFPLPLWAVTNDIRLSNDFSSELSWIRYETEVAGSRRGVIEYVKPPQMLVARSTSINDGCRGVQSSAFATPRGIFVQCGIMRSWVLKPAYGYRRNNFYACASAVKAVIKSVGFTYNGTTPHLEGLQVTDIRDKQYEDGESMPLWGVEDTRDAHGKGPLSPLWGIISPEYADGPNLTTYRQPSLYLSGPMTGSGVQVDAFGEFGNLAGIHFAGQMMRSAYCTDDSRNEWNQTACPRIFDYHGRTSMALQEKWVKLTASAETASTIPNLIFTDLAANAVTGTKGVGVEKRVVRPQVPTVTFNLVYMPPAALGLAATLLIIMMAFAEAFRGESGIAAMRHHMQRLAPGRIFTTLLGPAGKEEGLNMGSKAWSSRFGARTYDTFKLYRVVESVDEYPERTSDHEQVSGKGGDVE